MDSDTAHRVEEANSTLRVALQARFHSFLSGRPATDSLSIPKSSRCIIQSHEQENPASRASGAVAERRNTSATSPAPRKRCAPRWRRRRTRTGSSPRTSSSRRGRSCGARTGRRSSSSASIPTRSLSPRLGPPGRCPLRPADPVDPRICISIAHGPVAPLLRGAFLLSPAPPFLSPPAPRLRAAMPTLAATT